MGSASTRPSAASTSTRSTESGSTRERICSSASSTVSTSLLYYAPPGSAGGGDGWAPPRPRWPTSREVALLVLGSGHPDYTGRGGAHPSPPPADPGDVASGPRAH